MPSEVQEGLQPGRDPEFPQRRQQHAHGLAAGHLRGPPPGKQPTALPERAAASGGQLACFPLQEPWPGSPLRVSDLSRAAFSYTMSLTSKPPGKGGGGQYLVAKWHAFLIQKFGGGSALPLVKQRE